MYNILTLNKIAECGLEKLDKNLYSVSESCDNPDGIILRSFSMHDMELADSLKAVARAGAGVNNIPIDACSEKGIVVFNTPGANANAVKELAITAILLSSRKIVDGINWATTLKGQEDANKQVEKGKSSFVGPEIKGKKLGVVGLGAIGLMVANTACALGMEVIGYDPYASADAVKDIKLYDDLNELVKESDYISIHVPQNDATKGMFNKDLFGIMKKGVRIINLSRDGLVNNADIKEAIENGIVACYVTDFPTVETIGMDGVICIPHLGASTPESEDNCAVMAAMEIDDYLSNGNIVNSVNFPNCKMSKDGKNRITVLYKNNSAVVDKFSDIISESKIVVINMLNKSKNDNAYTIIDTDSDITDDIIAKFEGIDGVLKVRAL